ncbi:MAG: ABC transporter substrate-binding protein [Eubacteriales bacterium]|nr:ABC transporter substrate-binding protein [Eubacteriales bacterium]
MKKVLCVLLALLLTMTGCARQAAEPEEELIVVGMSQVGAESDWRVANTESMRREFTEEKGYRLLFEDARQKQENQISAIRRFIQQRVDYIVVMPIGETGWDSVLQEAKKAGIPVILVDRTVDVEDESLIAARVGADFYGEGRKAVAWMEQTFGAEPIRIVHIQGTLGATSQLGRTAALEEGLARNESWELLAQLDGDYTQAKSYELMSDYLSQFPVRPKIDVVYCENDNEAYGAIEALEENGYICGPEGVAVISFDAAIDALLYCREGKIALEVECNPLLGPLAESVIRSLEAGQTPEKNYYVDEQVFLPGDITDELLGTREY